MVDYSKWDHLDISDDDESDNDNNSYDDFFDEEFVEGVQKGGRNNSSVTKLAPGTSVTFGNGKVQYGHQQEAKGGKEAKDGNDGKQPRKSVNAGAYEKYTRNGGGDPNSTHIWGQTREEVQVCVFVPAGARGRDVKVDVRSALGKTPRLKVCHMGKTLVDEELAHPVDTSEDALAGCYTLEDYDSARRVVKVELKKSTIGTSVFWWDRALSTDAKISQDAIVDIDKSGTAEENRRKWQEAWEEAHREFKKQVANQKPMEINVDN